jgi:hypothetical protein
MAKVEQPSERAGFSIYLFEAVLAVTSGAVGLVKLLKEGSPSAESIFMMLALPVAAALVAGSLGRLTVEGRTRPHWSAALAMPAMHGATLYALAKLVEAKYTGIEAPDRIHPSLIWAIPLLIFLSAGAQVLALGLFFALLRKK